LSGMLSAEPWPSCRGIKRAHDGGEWAVASLKRRRRLTECAPPLTIVTRYSQPGEEFSWAWKMQHRGWMGCQRAGKLVAALAVVFVAMFLGMPVIMLVFGYLCVQFLVLVFLVAYLCEQQRLLMWVA